MNVCPRCRERPRDVTRNGRLGPWCLVCELNFEAGPYDPICPRCDERPRARYKTHNKAGHYQAWCKECMNDYRRVRHDIKTHGVGTGHGARPPKRVLSDEEVRRLRRMVGLDPETGQ